MNKSNLTELELMYAETILLKAPLQIGFGINELARHLKLNITGNKETRRIITGVGNIAFYDQFVNIEDFLRDNYFIKPCESEFSHWVLTERGEKVRKLGSLKAYYDYEEKEKTKQQKKPFQEKYWWLIGIVGFIFGSVIAPLFVEWYKVKYINIDKPKIDTINKLKTDTLIKK